MEEKQAMKFITTYKDGRKKKWVLRIGRVCFRSSSLPLCQEVRDIEVGLQHPSSRTKLKHKKRRKQTL